MNELIALVLKQEDRIDIIVSLEVRRQDLLLYELEVLSEIKIAIGEELRVRRVVVLIMEGYKLIVLQISDILRFAS